MNNNTATNFSGTPDTLTVSGTTWSNHNQPVSGGTNCFGDHSSVNADTGGNFRLIVNNSSGLDIVNATNETNGGISVQATAGGTNGKMDASITALKTSNNTTGVVIADTGTGATVTFNVFSNKTANGTGFSGTGSLALAVTHVSAAGTTTGTTDDNSVTHTAGPGPRSPCRSSRRRRNGDDADLEQCRQREIPARTPRSVEAGHRHAQSGASGANRSMARIRPERHCRSST